jgi:hypothetical protein
MDQLNDLRETTPGCVVVAFADLSSSIMLCASSAIKQPQERLDSISSNAVGLLTGKTSQTVSSVLGTTTEPHVYEAIALNNENIQIFLRSREEVNDALCCICSIDVDSEAFMGRAREVLKNISAAPQ